MRAHLVLALAMVVTGCLSVSTSSDRSTVTTKGDEALLEAPVSLAPGMSSVALTFEVPANASNVRVEATGDASNVRLRIEGCPADTRNLQVNVAGDQVARAACGDLPEGAFTVQVQRDAGAGDVNVKVVAYVVRVQRTGP